MPNAETQGRKWRGVLQIAEVTGEPPAGQLGFRPQLEVLPVASLLASVPCLASLTWAQYGEHTEERSNELPCPQGGEGAAKAAGRAACVDLHSGKDSVLRSLWKVT